MLLVPQAARAPQSASRATGEGATAAAGRGGCHWCGRRAFLFVTAAHLNTYWRLHTLFVIDRSAVSATVPIQPIQPIKASKAPASLPPAHTASAGSRGNHEAAHQRSRGNSARASRGRGGEGRGGLAPTCLRARRSRSQLSGAAHSDAGAGVGGGSAQYIFFAVFSAAASAHCEG